MKTRIVVHIALNAKGGRVGCLVCVAGRFIPYDGQCFDQFAEDWKERSSSDWMNSDYSTEQSLKEWKKNSINYDNASIFQRVTLLGETK